MRVAVDALCIGLGGPHVLAATMGRAVLVHAGKIGRKHEPYPRRVSTTKRPPTHSTMPLQVARPRPEPQPGSVRATRARTWSCARRWNCARALARLGRRRFATLHWRTLVARWGSCCWMPGGNTHIPRSITCSHGVPSNGYSSSCTLPSRSANTPRTPRRCEVVKLPWRTRRCKKCAKTFETREPAVEG